MSGTLLPSYISLQTAEKILFVGESVNMFSLQANAGGSSSHDVGQFMFSCECLSALAGGPV